MTERTEKKKKIYQLAKELNISHDTLMEFLQKKGHPVKSHMSVVEDEVMGTILGHFKKEKESAEKHHRKIQTLRETRKPVTPERKEAEKKEVEKKTAVKRKVEKPPSEKIEPPVVEKPTAEEPRRVITEEQVQTPSGEEIMPQVEPTVEKPVVPEAKPTPSERVARKVIGLKIKGKIDLEARQGETEPEEASQAEGVASTTLEDQKKKKKKKRKIVVGQTEEVDELDVKKKKRKKLRHREIDQEEVDEAIRRTLQEIEEHPVDVRGALKKRKKREREEREERLQQEMEREKTRVRVTEFVTVNELANLMSVNVADVIKKCIDLGLMVSINQRLDKDTITLVSDEFGFEVEFLSEIEEDVAVGRVEVAESLKPRAPVVTIMGHVDHGKTSLLDYIRRANVVAGEAGGITQHIGAYEVTLDSGKQITFLDTPGHEAFTAMRARGAQVTDIVVLVVAAEDNVMPQTIEAISHAQAAGVPIVVAINKIDKPDANPERIKQQLADRGVLVEEWGGKYQSVAISARSGQNVDRLLEKILLEAELLDLKANPERPAQGVVIEARLDKGKGIMASILVQKGTLRIGDPFVAGVYSGQVRAMVDERGNRVEAARPSTPVQVIGFDGIPQAGDTFVVVESSRHAREISVRRQQLKREQDFRQKHVVSLDNLSQQIQDGNVKELNVVVKGDVDGSVGALADSLMKLTNVEVRVRVIHKAVGGISESDVLLAAASKAVIIGFHVRPNLAARQLAEQENVDIRLYNIIYDAINNVKKALEGLLEPEHKEEIAATVEVRQTFKVPKVGTVAGCYVQDGKIARNNKVRLIRDGVVKFDGTISSLKRFKDDVREVEQGFECGLSLEGFHDVKEGDIIEAYRVVELKRTLA
jgi:translation initiation factor IF-2